MVCWLPRLHLHKVWPLMSCFLALQWLHMSVTWASWLVKPPVTRLFVHAVNIRNNKVLYHWTLWLGNPLGTDGFSPQRFSNAESVSIVCHHHGSLASRCTHMHWDNRWVILTHWSYVFLALTHRNMHPCFVVFVVVWNLLLRYPETHGGNLWQSATSTDYWYIASKLKAPRNLFWISNMFLWVEIFIFFVCYHVVPKRHSLTWLWIKWFVKQKET